MSEEDVMRSSEDGDAGEDEGGGDGDAEGDSTLQDLHTMCHQYADYMYTTADPDPQVKAIDESIEEMLMRLDEFKSIIDMISGDTSLCVQKTLPEVYQKSLEMQRIFYKIDMLERFVQLVKENLDAVEQQVNEAESKMGAFSSIIKIFTNLQPFTRKQQQQAAGSSPVRSGGGVDIFHTEDYFSPAAAAAAADTSPAASS